MVVRWVRLAETYGVDGRELTREAGIDARVLDDPDGRIEVARSDELAERLDALARDPLIGVRLAAVRDTSTYDAAGIALLSASTLRLGFARAFRCQTIWGDGERFTMAKDVIAFDPGRPHRRAHEIVTECALVEIAGAVRALAGPQASPLRVSLHYDASDRSPALAETFGCEVTVGGRRSEIAFRARHLDAPIPAAIIEATGLFRPTTDASFAAAIADVATRALVSGDATLVGVATRFGLSPRTVQRRLAHEGRAFERIVDDARRHLAASLLAKGVAIAEVGGLLGYSDKAAFYRAFKRWNGTTPDRARRAADRLASGSGLDQR